MAPRNHETREGKAHHFLDATALTLFDTTKAAMRDDINVVLGGVGLVKGGIKEAGQAMVEITKEINPFLVDDRFLAGAPFNLLNGIIRYGTKFDPYAEVGPIDRRNSELPFAVEIELAPLRRAPREEVKTAFLKALIPAIFAIALKFDLPTEGLIAFSQSKGISTTWQ